MVASTAKKKIEKKIGKGTDGLEKMVMLFFTSGMMRFQEILRVCGKKFTIIVTLPKPLPSREGVNPLYTFIPLR
jgi:hypothetical protein